MWTNTDDGCKMWVDRVPDVDSRKILDRFESSLGLMTLGTMNLQNRIHSLSIDFRSGNEATRGNNNVPCCFGRWRLAAISAFAKINK